MCFFIVWPRCACCSVQALQHAKVQHALQSGISVPWRKSVDAHITRIARCYASNIKCLNTQKKVPTNPS